jgi:TP901 family phage tail tape measure protein
MALASRTRRINIYVNGTAVTNDIKSITAAMNALNNKTRTLNVNSEEYVRNMAQIKQLKHIIADHNAALSTTSFHLLTLKGLANAFNKYWPVIMGTIGTITGFVMGIKNVTEAYTKFDDKLADVMKTTGLTRDQVVSMNEAFKQLDTRTAQDGLLDLAYIAGKLGYATEEDVYGFVVAMDKIGVSLKEDLGGNIEETANQLGKLVEVFQLRDTFTMEESLLKVGSAINALGMASTANEQFLVQFAKRTAGIAPLAGVSIQNVLGLAAATDMLGQSAEVSATAYTMFMGKLNKETAKFANLTGTTFDEFRNLVETDANGAMLLVLKNLEKTEGGLQSLVEGMDQVGMDGQRVTAVLGAWAHNYDILIEQQKIANKEFDLGTSILNEYAIKNNTAQAQVDKNTKKLSNLTIELGEKLVPAYLASQTAAEYFMRSIVTLVGFTIKYSTTIISLTAALIAYKTAVAIAALQQNLLTSGTIINNIVLAAAAIRQRIHVFWINAQSIAWLYLRGNISLATAALGIFNVALGVSGIGIFAALLVGAASAMALYFNSTSDAANETKNLNDEIKRLSAEKTKSIIQEKTELDLLLRSINLTNEGSAFRIKLIDELKSKYPDLLGFIDSETISNDELSKAMESVNNNIRQRIELSAIEAKSEAIQNKMVENGMKMLDITDEIKKAREEASKPDADRYDYEIPALIQEKEKEYNALSSENDMLIQQLDTLQSQKKDAIDEIKQSRITALTSERQLLLDELALKSKIVDIDQSILSGLTVRIATINKLLKLQETGGTSDGDPFAETTEQDRILEEKKKFLSGQVKDKFTHEQNIRRIELEFMQGRLNTREYEADKLRELQIQIEDKKIEIMEAGNKESSRIADTKLKNDFEFNKQKLILIQKRVSGEIDTEEEYNEKLLQLEIDFLRKRLLSQKEGSESFVETSLLLNEKLIQQQDAVIKRLAELRALATKDSLIAQENEAYQALLIKFNLNKDKEQLTKEEFAALEGIQKAHQTKLNELDAKSYKDYFDKKQETFDYEIAMMKANHDEQLEQVRGNKEEYNRLQNQFQAEEQKLVLDHVQAIITEINALQTDANIEGLDLSDAILSEEESRILLDILTKIAKARAEALGQKPEKDLMKYGFNDNNIDLLGFSPQDWMDLISNLKKGELGVQEVAMAVLALRDAYGQYAEFIATIEDRNLARKEADAEKQKEVLSKQLEFGLISQENYNKQVSVMDNELDAERARVARKQAIREKMMAITSATINTALAVTKLLDVPWLAIAAGVLGAAQIALIAATPIPEIPGAEAGGSLYQRAQDGKTFNASYQPNRRGFIASPTVITGENGLEYVIPAEGMQNPAIRSIVDNLEVARLNKNLSSVNFDDIINKHIVPGRQSGGFITQQPTANSQQQITSVLDPETKALLSEYNRAVNQLNKKLDIPIKSYVSLYGDKGFFEAIKEDEVIKSNSNL